MRTLTQRELNRALLARQGLLERLEPPLPRFVERIGGLQTQYAPSGYIGSWSRLEGFERDQLTRALERRTVVQATLMRSTIHMISRRDYWPIVTAVREHRRRWWLQATRHAVSERNLEACAGRIRAALADGPQRRSALMKELGLDSRTWNGATGWLDLVRVPPSGTWERRRADLYGLADDWIGPPPADLTPDAGLDLLVRRYLTGFGPASRKDISSFTGVPLPAVDAALEGIRIRRFLSWEGEPLVDLPGRPIPDDAPPVPVRFLPTWDATLLVHARRTLILPEHHRSKIFHVKIPQSLGTFLVDGQVAGTWRHDDDRVSIDPFVALPRAVRREVDGEAERLAAFMA
jgi:hypothetical protein